MRISTHIHPPTSSSKRISTTGPNSWTWDVLSSGVPRAENGVLRVPDAPGWGVELNEDEALKHPYGERNFLLPVRKRLGNPASQIRTAAAAFAPHPLDLFA